MAKGYSTGGDLVTATIDGRDLNEMWAEFQNTLEEHNRQRQRLLDLLTFSVTRPVERIPIMGGNIRFEEASEFGEPVGVGTRPQFTELAYDFKWYDLAVRYTWKFLVDATAQQVESLHNLAMNADKDLLLRRVLEAVFDHRNRTANIDGRTFTVHPFYNGDGTVPPAYKQRTWDGTETHYLTSGGTEIVGDDIVDLYLKITQKGFGDGTGMRVLVLANEQEVEQIRGFRRGDEDTEGNVVSPFDFIPVEEDLTALVGPHEAPVGDLPPASARGMEVAGRYGKALIVEENFIPAGYLVAIVSDGTNSTANPVGIREHENVALRGLRLIKGRDNSYPLVDSYYGRAFGTGIRHRGAGAVMQITDAATYTPPTDYTREW